MKTMHRNRILTLALAAMLLSGFAAATRADEIAAKGQAIINKYQHAVVTLPEVLKLSQGSNSREIKQEITGTIVDPSGLTVVALSMCDPTVLSRRASPESKMEGEVTDIKILLEDGTELPAEIVTRDEDLDMAFIRPKTKPEKPLTAIDLNASGQAQALDPVISLNRLNKAASRAYSASLERVAAVVQKPRTCYVPDTTATSTALGCPAFTLEGKVLGIFVMRVVSSGGSERASATPIIVPAADVLNDAKQAMEAKVEPEKKPEPKEETKKETE